MKLMTFGESRRRVLNWDGLSKREKAILWKDPFRENQRYIRYGRAIYDIKEFSLPPSRLGLEEFDLIKYTSYTSGLGVYIYKDYWKLCQFTLEVEA